MDELTRETKIIGGKNMTHTIKGLNDYQLIRRFATPIKGKIDTKNGNLTINNNEAKSCYIERKRQTACEYGASIVKEKSDKIAELNHDGAEIIAKSEDIVSGRNYTLALNESNKYMRDRIILDSAKQLSEYKTRLTSIVTELKNHSVSLTILDEEIFAILSESINLYLSKTNVSDVNLNNFSNLIKNTEGYKDLKIKIDSLVDEYQATISQIGGELYE